MLEIRQLVKSYPGANGHRVLDGVTLTLAQGEYVAVMGESGVGKSTLLNLIAGLDLPDGGAILLEGVDLGSLDETRRTELRRRRMGFVFQAFHLLPHLTVAQNVALPLALNHLSDPQRVEQLLGSVGLGARGGAYPRQLSGGELQRVAIARALVHRPALVLADEPTGNLDPDTAARVLEVLRRQLKADRVTRMPLAAATCDRIYELTPRGVALRDSPP